MSTSHLLMLSITCKKVKQSETASQMPKTDSHQIKLPFGAGHELKEQFLQSSPCQELTVIIIDTNKKISTQK